MFYRSARACSYSLRLDNAMRNMRVSDRLMARQGLEMVK
jgi:hypothetical protein